MDRRFVRWVAVAALVLVTAATGYVLGTPGRIGVIPSVTEPFCEACDRLRLTVDGRYVAIDPRR